VSPIRSRTPMRKVLARAALTLLVAAIPCVPALAQSVALTGTMGPRALVVIDGGAPAVLAAGETRDGVTLVSADGDDAIVQIKGRRIKLHVGDVPVNLGAERRAAGGSRIVMNAVAGGHFVGAGQINGISVQFLVDTGASTVVLSASEAQRIGLEYLNGQRGLMATANGVTTSYMVRLDSIRIGDVEVFGVDATVVPSSLPMVLLGNTFLARFQLKQENALLILDKRY
jgi:aspartyl protease family protein